MMSDKKFSFLLVLLLVFVASLARGNSEEKKIQRLEQALSAMVQKSNSVAISQSISSRIAILKKEWSENVYASLKKEILLSNPDLPEKLVFITRNQYARDHHNTATLFQKGEVNEKGFDPGAAMKLLDLQSGKTTTLLETKEGIVRDPEMSFDGKRMLFSYRKNSEDAYHIYEMKADGTDMKQLTFSNGVSDIDPLYLPNNQIIFSSTREPKYCMCNRHIMANLYRMNPDGSNITQLGKSTLFEGHSALLNDGRVIYDRWEYVDRNFGDAQGLWTVNPDGTKHAIYYGNNTNSPGGVIDPRPIPGSNLILCIFGSCHDRPWGALTLLDRSKGVDGKEAVVKIFPEKARNLIGKGNWDAFMPLEDRYEDPYPINENLFLVSKSLSAYNRNHNAADPKMGLFLVDIYGNELLLHKEAQSCFDPIPLTERFRPQEIPTARKFDDSPGFFYVQDVYESTHMENVTKGAVKYLRVVESPEKRTFTAGSWSGQGAQAPGMNWHSFENKKILGTVPVEEDGSTYFEAPSNTYLFFQLLDENKKMIQSMRSGVMVLPGETNGCIGCHEDRLSVPTNVNKMPMAMRKNPHRLAEQNLPDKTFSYTEQVQPIFDKYCVSCHDFGKFAGESIILAGDRNPFFNASYVDLYVKKLIQCVGGGPSGIQQAYSWGSHPSKLIQVIEAGHNEIKLSKEEKEMLYSWLDLNGVYYPEYESAYPDNLAGRSPLSSMQINRLKQLTGVDFSKLNRHGRTVGPQISFERPELSPCLSGIKKDKRKYKEALAIIKAGYKQLQKQPRADMSGFEPCNQHFKQLEKYKLQQYVEDLNNQAIVNGEKRFDKATN